MKRVESALVRPPWLVLGVLLLGSIWLGGAMRPGSVAGSTLQTDGQRLAIAALDPSADAKISPLAGRAPYFLVFETGAGLIDVVRNDFAMEKKAAGTRTAHLISTLEVDCLVAGEVGPRMSSVLDAEGVSFVVARGQASEVAGRLLPPGL